MPSIFVVIVVNSTYALEKFSETLPVIVASRTALPSDGVDWKICRVNESLKGTGGFGCVDRSSNWPKLTLAGPNCTSTGPPDPARKFTVESPFVLVEVPELANVPVVVYVTIGAALTATAKAAAAISD